MVPLLVVQAGCLALGIPLSYHVMCFEKIQQRRGVLERNPALTCWGAGLGTTWFVLSVFFSLRLQLSAPLVRLQWASLNIHVWSPITFRACQHLLIRRRTENSSDRSFCSKLVRRPPQQVVSQLNKRTFKFWGAFALQHLCVEVLLHHLAPAHYLAIIHTFGTNLILLVAALFVFLRTPKKPDPLHLRKDLRICLYSWAGFFWPCTATEHVWPTGTSSVRISLFGPDYLLYYGSQSGILIRLRQERTTNSTTPQRFTSLSEDLRGKSNGEGTNR
mmetsp:Transcript_28764/g.47303  ORF Transcript_28764/g.47303 Transcript_28764/m.47303 type:complete len:274 (+) Transcript_28764:84-905(+)